MNKSPHILNTSANLLGFTFLVLTSIKGFGLPQAGFIDEFVAVCVVIFSFSCFFSFLSMRSKKAELIEQYETWSDYLFLAGLIILALVSALLSLAIVTFAK